MATPPLQKVVSFASVTGTPTLRLESVTQQRVNATVKMRRKATSVNPANPVTMVIPAMLVLATASVHPVASSHPSQMAAWEVIRLPTAAIFIAIPKTKWKSKIAFGSSTRTIPLEE